MIVKWLIEAINTDTNLHVYITPYGTEMKVFRYAMLF